MKFCKDCKHYTRSRMDAFLRLNPSYAKCAASRVENTNPVTGLPTHDDEYCSSERRSYGKCGPDALLWEEK